MTGLSPGTVTLFDGAISTELFRRGCPRNSSPEVYALEHPTIIEQIHEEYIQAGSAIITTATFGVNAARLARDKISESARTVNQLLASLAVGVSGGRARVAGSIGPVASNGESKDLPDVESQFEDQINGLVQGGVDLLLIETMTNSTEALEALRTARCISQVPVAVSFAFDQNLMTADEKTIEQVVAVMESEGAAMIGANCMTSPDRIIEAVRRIKAVSTIPILARPNAGIPDEMDGKLVYPMSPGEFVSLIGTLIDAGAGAVGGCCGTSPEFMRAVKADLESTGRR